MSAAREVAAEQVQVGPGAGYGIHSAEPARASSPAPDYGEFELSVELGVAEVPGKADFDLAEREVHVVAVHSC